MRTFASIRLLDGLGVAGFCHKRVGFNLLAALGLALAAGGCATSGTSDPEAPPVTAPAEAQAAEAQTAEAQTAEAQAAEAQAAEAQTAEAQTAEAQGTSDCGRVSGAEARRLIAEGATLLDVRSQQEFDAGHLEGATLIPGSEISQRISELPKQNPVVVYCHSGRRAGLAADELRNQGYKVYNLGGIDNWDSTQNPCQG